MGLQMRGVDHQGYGVITAERDIGRLRTLMSYPLRASQLLFQRLLVRMLLLGVPLTAFAVGGALWTRPSGGLDVASLSLWVLTAWISMLFWWALVGLANLSRLRAETAAMVLIAVWAGLVLVVPALISAFAAALYPPPSRQALTVEIRHHEVIARDASSDTLKRLMHDHPDWQAQGDAYVADWMKAAAVDRGRIESEVQGSMLAFGAQLAAQQ